jgi:succinyl-CoA synthetase beta subunit
VKIHEYQAKELLRKFNVPVPEGYVAFTPNEAVQAARKLPTVNKVVKAQIHAGGRGKGGGIKIARDIAEVESLANKMLGMKLVTHQTGPAGKIVKKLLIEQGVDIEKELYLGIVLDRTISRNVMMVSTEGGVEIEKVAAENPEMILKEWIDPKIGLQPFQARKLVFGLGLSGAQIQNAIKFMLNLYNAFISMDCSLAEINPLVVTKNGEVLALDAKINFDDSSLFRNPSISELRDLDEEEPLEVEASKYHLNYIKLEGNVGCMVNGAGLAMATMDIIKLAGGEPANFLDVGGNANVETVRNGFKIILADENVKAVLINIFGGIVRCDRVARGVIEAVQTMDIKVPVVVRLEGTNASEASLMLQESNLDFVVADSLQDAAQKVVTALSKNQKVQSN